MNQATRGIAIPRCRGEALWQLNNAWVLAIRPTDDQYPDNPFRLQ